MMLDGNHEHYLALRKKYQEYVLFYKFLNGGSEQGVCSFAEFYWRFTYYIHYEDVSTIGVGSI